MKIFLNVTPTAIVINVPSPPGVKMDLHKTILPGEQWHGWSFGQLTELGSGIHEIDEK